MKTNNLFIKIITFLFFLVNINIAEVQAKNFSDIYFEVFSNAYSLEQNNCLKEAALEYKRYIFLNSKFYSENETEQINLTTNENKLHACSFLADYYYNLSDYDNAFKYNNYAVQCTKKYSLQNEIAFFRDINLMYDSKEFLYNDYKFLQYLIPGAYSKSVTAFAYCRLIKDAVLVNETYEAKKYFDSACCLFPDFFDLHAGRLFYASINSIESFKPKNPTFATGLSIIPGLGQLYAGFPEDALNAFILNGALIGVSAWSLGNLNFVDFGLLEAGWVYRFYKGNFYNAAKDVRLYNQNKLNELNAPAMEILNAVENRIKNQYILEHD